MHSLHIYFPTCCIAERTMWRTSAAIQGHIYTVPWDMLARPTLVGTLFDSHYTHAQNKLIRQTIDGYAYNWSYTNITIKLYIDNVKALNGLAPNYAIKMY